MFWQFLKGVCAKLFSVLLGMERKDVRIAAACLSYTILQTTYNTLDPITPDPTPNCSKTDLERNKESNSILKTIMAKFS